MGTRDQAAGLDFSGVLPEEVEAELKDAAMISMGTEISAEDLDNIRALADQVGAEGAGSSASTSRGSKCSSASTMHPTCVCSMGRTGGPCAWPAAAPL
jgi:hypothetical protein